MLRHLLDTNILSDLLRNPGGQVARRLAVVGEATVCTSVVVACELRYGAAKKGSPKLSALAESLHESLEILLSTGRPTATMPRSACISIAPGSRSDPTIS